ncbi:MAG: iron-containing alcohol dehydrogenase, partial [Atribacterota bacterium]|nr:iron-containing alcohol dehydrogenase [Atribacterota bacterium]
MQNKETNEKEKRSKMIEEVHYLWKEDVGMCEFDNIWEFTMASRIKFGIGVSKEVGFEARKIGGRKVILITDKVITKLGLANTVINSLADAGFEISVYDQVDPDPTTETYNKCIDF